MRSLARLRAVATGMVALVAVMALLEVLARVAETARQDITNGQAVAPHEWFVYSPTLGWERKPGYRGYFVKGHPDATGPVAFDEQCLFVIDSPHMTDTTRKKVLFIGDSNVFGLGTPTGASFAEVVAALVPDVNAINLGVPGYTSFQALVALKKYVPLLKPDVVVVSVGLNDRRYVPTLEDTDSADHFQRVYRASRSAVGRVVRVLSASYAFRAFRSVLRRAGLVQRSAQPLPLADAPPRVDEVAYRRNLSQMVVEARRLGTPLIFVSLRDDPIETQHLRQGVDYLSVGEYGLAIAHLRVAAESGNMFADLARVHLARAYRAHGDTTAAQQVLDSSHPIMSQHGGRLMRWDTTYTHIVQGVGVELGVPVVDAGRALLEHPESFIDYCHFDSAGHRRVGELVARQVSAVLAGDGARLAR
jgi:lysophospholipase L1-like esterase